ncbi:hypothetical protein FQN60_006892 [Etheostoma spectabile]|uniref:Ig-like domain-containing protein n=1 Tax=Etheostoma spectabile TaxID=54343 RepID=A0A5J5CH56_9PERO|nr:hypothetical protein FQN60_006892 [Etheostoma spectabile]
MSSVLKWISPGYTTQKQRPLLFSVFSLLLGKPPQNRQSTKALQPYMVKCETALTSDDKERKVQNEKNNWTDAGNNDQARENRQSLCCLGEKQISSLLAQELCGEGYDQLSPRGLCLRAGPGNPSQLQGRCSEPLRKIPPQGSKVLSSVPAASAPNIRMLMKMAAASTTSLLLLCCFAISRTVYFGTHSQDPCDYNALKGKDFIVPLSLKLEPSHRLKWKHNDNFIFDQRQGKVLFKRKEDDVSENGSLKLTNLNDRHKGIYTPELFNQDGNVIENRKRPAPKPKVTKVCSSADVTFTCGVQAEVYILSCSHPNPSINDLFTQLAKDLKFAWLQNDKDLKEYTKTLKRNAEQVEKDSFRCKVFNPASSETSDAVTQEPCYKRSEYYPVSPFSQKNY